MRLKLSGSKKKVATVMSATETIAPFLFDVTLAVLINYLQRR
ncbi:hypothetical protein ACFLV6_00955 [Chloroflexota bacterium]